MILWNTHQRIRKGIVQSSFGYAIDFLRAVPQCAALSIYCLGETKQFPFYEHTVEKKTHFFCFFMVLVLYCNGGIFIVCDIKLINNTLISQL